MENELLSDAVAEETLVHVCTNPKATGLDAAKDFAVRQGRKVKEPIQEGEFKLVGGTKVFMIRIVDVGASKGLHVYPRCWGVYQVTRAD